MEQIFVANPKGGCGKTTISAQLAAYFSLAGKRTMLVDHDALKCSSDWLAGRPASLPKIDSVIASVDADIEFNGAEFIIHDMPAAWTLENVQNILHAQDCVLIPILSSPNDIKAALRFVMNLYRSGILESGIRLGLVANRIRPNTLYSKVLDSFLTRLDVPVVAILRDTQNYVRAMDGGLSIFDLPPSKVTEDLEQWQSIINWIDKNNAEQHRHTA